LLDPGLDLESLSTQPSGESPYTRRVVARTRRIEVRVTEDERSLEEAAATALGLTLSEFFRQAARARAEQVLAERTRLVLDEAEAERFLSALEDPGPQRFDHGLRRLTGRERVIPS
jgi:uncharacterized protein (DUF1778 family)